MIIVLIGALAVDHSIEGSTVHHTHEPSYPTQTPATIVMTSSGSIAVSPFDTGTWQKPD
jgi:hypothetical protein